MKTQIFAYKGNLAATTDLVEGKFINDPKAAGQLGCVISTSEVQITKEAKELIKNARREGGSFAPLMLTKHAGSAVDVHGKSSVGLMGAGKHHFGKDFTLGRDCDKSVLEDCEEVEIEVPADYKEFIDENEG